MTEGGVNLHYNFLVTLKYLKKENRVDQNEDTMRTRT
jgi:hypothetical protein